MSQEGCFKTLVAQKFPVCDVQGIDSTARTMVKITNFEQRMGGQTVRLNYFNYKNKLTIYFSRGAPGPTMFSTRMLQGPGSQLACRKARQTR